MVPCENVHIVLECHQNVTLERNTLDTVKKWDLGAAYWLGRCAISRTVPGSIPGVVTVFFSDIFPSDRTMVLGSTQPLVKMSTSNITWGLKAAGA